MTPTRNQLQTRTPPHGPRRNEDPVFSRVLVGVDGSPNGEEAVRQAASLCRFTGAELELAHVEGTRALPLGSEPVHDGARALRSASLLAESLEVPAALHAVTGSPVTALTRLAYERWADLLVVGPDASLIVKPRILGRVAAGALHAARGSVLVARVPSGTEQEAFPRRILCPVDGSTGALEAVRTAARLASASGASLRLLNVITLERAPALGFMVSSAPGDPLPPAAEVARSWGVEAGMERVIGAAGPSISAAAAADHADLIVVGSRGLHGIRRALGSVSDWVARHAGTSVLVVRPRPH